MATETCDVLVQAQGIGKTFPLFQRRRARASALLSSHYPVPRRQVLDDVSFAVRKGEALGLVGDNGSGKSTLLRIIAGIYKPDTGTLRVQPPVAAILELGLGFHPDLTGRENAYLYGSLLGIPKEELACRVPRILEFSELEWAADLPLRTYSSGMSARLAFSVATELSPTVLLVDEALAVGDNAFQKKCIDRMLEFKSEGRGIVFCSHSLYLVASFCERALWLKDGRVAAVGPTSSVLAAYEEHLSHRAKRTLETPSTPVASSTITSFPRITQLTVVPPQRVRRAGEPLAIHVRIAPGAERVPFHAGVALDTPDGTSLATAFTHRDGLSPLVAEETIEVVCRFSAVPLARGPFLISGFVFDSSGLALWDQVRLPDRFEIKTDIWQPSLLELDHTWEVMKP